MNCFIISTEEGLPQTLNNLFRGEFGVVSYVEGSSITRVIPETGDPVGVTLSLVGIYL